MAGHKITSDKSVTVSFRALLLFLKDNPDEFKKIEKLISLLDTVSQSPKDVFHETARLFRMIQIRMLVINMNRKVKNEKNNKQKK